MDFVQIATKEVRGGIIELRPDFIVKRSNDLMVQGGAFYAVWDEPSGLWSRDEYRLRELVDEVLYAEAEKLKATGVECVVKPLSNFSNGGWRQFRQYVKNISDNSHPLDSKVTFANTEVKKKDYVSRRLSYSLEKGSMAHYEELVSLLYTEEERKKFEWAIGAIIEGDAKKIHKFLVFFGPGGTGKSTIMDIIMMLFGGLVKAGGYVSTFVAKDLVGSNNAFSTEAFKDNPLVAIQQDGDLSNIQDNSKLNSVVSHDDMRINEKYKATYDSKINAFLFMGTNKPVMITDSKSGLIRRLIDVNPTRKTHRPERYHVLIKNIAFEIGAIAYHCHQRYLEMGRSYYSDYEPTNMMFHTDDFFNFVEAHHDIFKRQDGAALQQAWDLYKAWVLDANIPKPLKKSTFREGLKDYFEDFKDRLIIDGVSVRSYYTGFQVNKFKTPTLENSKKFKLVLEETESLFDLEMLLQPAQYGNADENPLKYWTNDKRMIDGVEKRPRKDQVCNTQLGDIDTRKLHFVRVPQNHIVIDFDLTDENGEKSLEKNLEAAAEFPPTYAEISKSGKGVHLHYIWDGDVTELARVYSPGIEIKVYTGYTSLRRKLSFCNKVPVAHISTGLPFKEKKPMLDMSTLKSEKVLRDQIVREMTTKATHGYTKPTIDWIKKLLDDAYASGMTYDLSNLKNPMIAFANNSTNQYQACMKAVMQMKFKSADNAEETPSGMITPKDERIVFYDIEVYPNLFIVCWKFEDSDSVVTMINPSADEVRALFEFKLVGFYNRRYDNHILYAAHLGYNNAQLYELSYKLINGTGQAGFLEAYKLSFADVYDFTTDKKSLKKWMIFLKLPHIEMDLPWDQAVSKEHWERIAKYCENDVRATEAVFKYNRSDWVARQIVTALSGKTENDTNPTHAASIIFNGERNPQRAFVYTDLSELFPGYRFDQFASVDKSTYRGEKVGEGGYVYAEPGIYRNVAVLDVASMHPHSIKALNLFGPFTAKFVELMDARLVLKHAMQAFANDDVQDGHRLLDEAGAMMDGRLKPFIDPLRGLTNEDIVKELKGIEKALKLVINTVYGLTAATYDNPFRDPRNIDNIVAKRGALFMVDLKNAVQERGFQVIHIKTDSIKIPNATPEIIQFVSDFGKKYGYDFEHETTYDRICLVNDAVYIAKDAKKGKWTATGAQFQQPYVFKTLFSGEKLTFDDLCEPRSTQKGAIYLDFNEDAATPANPTDGMVFVGKTGLFTPVTNNVKGARLVKLHNDKFLSVQGTKGYNWVESEMIRKLKPEAVERMMYEDLQDALEGSGSIGDIVDLTYFENMANEAVKNIERFGSYHDFVAA